MSARIPAAHIKVKRAYDPPAASDGERILVDRLWPRGLTKEKAAVDRWLRELAPSEALRVWFGHDPARWSAFNRRYAEELSQHRDLVTQLRAAARARVITLLYAAHDEAHNNAVALRAILLGR